jgi:hypothetical protein
LEANVISVSMLSDSGQCLIEKNETVRWITADRVSHQSVDMVTLGRTDLTAVDLSEDALFVLFGEQQRHRLLDQHRSLTFSPDQLLTLDQDQSQGLILLRNGIAKVRRFNSEGEEDVLSPLGPGDLCDEMAVLNNGRRSPCGGDVRGLMRPTVYWPHSACSHVAPVWEPIASRPFRPFRIGNWPACRD